MWVRLSLYYNILQSTTVNTRNRPQNVFYLMNTVVRDFRILELVWPRPFIKKMADKVVFQYIEKSVT